MLDNRNILFGLQVCEDGEKEGGEEEDPEDDEAVVVTLEFVLLHQKFMGEVLQNSPEGETNEGDIVKLRSEVRSQHPDSLRWVDGVQSSIASICEKHRD